MSQHKFFGKTDTDKVMVICGWDVPLSGYFMMITQMDQDESYLFSNLSLPVPHPPTFDPFIAVLREYGIDMPEGLLEALEADKTQGANQAPRRWTFPGDGASDL